MQFPAQYEESVVKMVHCNRAPRLEDVVNDIYEKLRYQDSKKRKGDDGSSSVGQVKETKKSTASPHGKSAQKSPISKSLLRIWIVEHASQHGLDGATNRVWMVKTSLAKKYKLKSQLPKEIQEELMASVKIKPGKKRATSESPIAKEENPKKGYKKSKIGNDSNHQKDVVSMRPPSRVCTSKSKVKVAPKTIEEMKSLYNRRSLGYIISMVLIEVGPDAMTAEDIVEKAKAMGMDLKTGVTEATAKSIGRVLMHDANFVRLERGKYSLHAYHPHIDVFRSVSNKSASEDGSKDGEDPSNANEPRSGRSVAQAKRGYERAEKSLSTKRKALENAVAAMKAAQLALEDARKTEKLQLKNLGQGSETGCPDKSLDPSALARFTMPEEERIWRGAADDRKGMLEHRQRVQARCRQLEQDKRAFLENQRLKESEKRLELRRKVKSLEENLLVAEQRAKDAEKSVQLAQKSLFEAEQRLMREKDRREKEGKGTAERSKAAAKPPVRYPIEDLELHKEIIAVDTPVPDVVPSYCWKSADESNMLANTLHVADSLHHFGKYFGLKPCVYPELMRVLHASCLAHHSPAVRCSVEIRDASSTLTGMYVQILRTLISDAVQNDAFDANSGIEEEEEFAAPGKLWLSLLSEATWTEILWRFVMVQKTKDVLIYDRPSTRVLESAAAVAAPGRVRSSPLKVHDHICLLEYLVNLLLDTNVLRNLLQKREDAMIDAMKEARGDMAEERRKLKELLQNDPEQKAKGRSASVSNEKRENAGVISDRATQSISTSSVPDVDRNVSKPLLEDKAVVIDAASGRLVPSTEALKVIHVRCDELPEGLREFNGDPNDLKAKEEFEKMQKIAKRKMQKERIRWIADEQRRLRQEEAAVRASEEVKAKREKEKEAANAAIARAAEELEERLEKNSIRRRPLGFDRHHRCYWYGLAGHRAALYVEDRGRGIWGEISTIESVEKLMNSLDRRGIREKHLADSIERKLHGMMLAMRRVQKLKEDKSASTTTVDGSHENDDTGTIDKKPCIVPAPPSRRSSRKRQLIQPFAYGSELGMAVAGVQGISRQSSSVVLSLENAPADGRGKKRKQHYGAPLCVGLDALTTEVLRMLYSPFEFPAALLLLTRIPVLHNALYDFQIATETVSQTSFMEHWSCWISSFTSEIWNKRETYGEDSTWRDVLAEAIVLRKAISKQILHIEATMMMAMVAVARGEERCSESAVETFPSAGKSRSCGSAGDGSIQDASVDLSALQDQQSEPHDDSRRNEGQTFRGKERTHGSNDDEQEISNDDKEEEEHTDSRCVRIEFDENIHRVMWPSEEERDEWLCEVEGACSLLRLAYCIGVLEGKARRLLRTPLCRSDELDDANVVKRKSSYNSSSMAYSVQPALCPKN